GAELALHVRAQPRVEGCARGLRHELRLLAPLLLATVHRHRPAYPIELAAPSLRILLLTGHRRRSPGPITLTHPALTTYTSASDRRTAAAKWRAHCRCDPPRPSRNRGHCRRRRRDRRASRSRSASPPAMRAYRRRRAARP